MSCFDPLSVLPEERVLWNEPLSPYTTFRIGGPCRALLKIASEEELRAVLNGLREAGEPYAFIGRGSNLLVPDEGFPGYVLTLRFGMKKITIEGETLTAEAGAMLSEAAEEALKAGLSGLEFASGIPGTAGGALFMNAGAYGSEMKDVVRSAAVLMPDGRRLVLENEDLRLSYRHSVLSENGAIVLSVTFSLEKKDREAIRSLMDDLNRRRREKQPLDKGSAGSTFKRPEGHFAGKLIEEAGLKGYRIGDAAVSEKHAGFLVNEGHATFGEMIELIRTVQERVYAHSGVRLSPEVRILGGDHGIFR